MPTIDRSPSRRTLLATMGSAMVTGLAGCKGIASRERVRQSLDPFTDISVALESGYRSTRRFLETESGGLGIQFVNEQYLDGEPEPAKPAILFYDLTETGQYELLGAEWMVPSGKTSSPPSLFGQSFNGPMAGHRDEQPTHYGLHAWPFRENPNGLFAQVHQDVSEPSYMPELRKARTALRPYLNDLSAAKEDGYQHWYVLHYRHPEHSDSVSDPANPSAIIYCNRSDGSKRLVGAVWFISAQKVDEEPTLFGQTLDGPMPAHEPPQDRHYGMHVWLFSTNPRGMFETPTDREIKSCDGFYL